MRNEWTNWYFQVLRQQIAALQRGDASTREEMDWEDIDAILHDFQITYGQLQANLEATEDVCESLFQEKEDYFELFQFSPSAYLVTDANGLIREANEAIATLLNVSSPNLVGQPLTRFVAEPDRASFETRLKSLAENTGTQVWQISLCPYEREWITVQLHLAIVYGKTGQIETLRIGVYNLSQSQEALPFVMARSQPNWDQQQRVENVSVAPRLPVPRLPQSLDGLRVLVVDDEADIRDFATAVLNAYGIEVRAVASAVKALEELERFRPDVLFSDIRMPGKDGYSLIRQIRALETEQGGHLPAVAITAYQEEDEEKAINAGFEARLHKLAQPSRWIETLTELAKRTSL